MTTPYDLALSAIVGAFYSLILGLALAINARRRPRDKPVTT